MSQQPQLDKATIDMPNAIFGGTDPPHFWYILGDIFYDQTGNNHMNLLFPKYTKAVKQAIIQMTPGNHDFWISSAPPPVGGDPVGWGVQQWY